MPRPAESPPSRQGDRRPGERGAVPTPPAPLPLGVFSWNPGPPPTLMPVTQVYGWLFDEHGRVLVQETPTRFNLPGGTPEVYDADMPATLAREGMEESQVVVDDPVLLGFEESHAPDGTAVAMVRFAARITQFQPRRPDPDGGRLLGRRMTSVARAVQLLGWGESGALQAQAAAQVAEEVWRLPATCPTRPEELAN